MKLWTLAALGLDLAAAQQVIDIASFGHKPGALSPNGRAVPSWHISGDNDWTPQLLSDRVILTPIAPGTKRGALWTDAALPYPIWTAEMEFRVNGQEHGGGIMQVWYTKGNEASVGRNNIHTIHQFEGLAVVVDMHGGTGGMIRAFLNDGTVDYVNHHHLESLAFGHCEYSYRNLGRKSKLVLKQDQYGFEVSIDDRRCFRSDQIILPTNNYFGVTATSSETADSFEIFKFLTTAGAATDSRPPPQQQQHGDQQPIKRSDGNAQQDYQALPDIVATNFKTQQSQFEDLHNRVQNIGHQVDTAINEIHRSTSNVQGRVEQLHHEIAKQRNIESLEARVASLEGMIQALKRDQKDWTGHFNDIHASLKARHDTLLDKLPESMGDVLVTKGPNIKLFLFLLLGFQALLAAAYVVYKRRLGRNHQKYL